MPGAESNSALDPSSKSSTDPLATGRKGSREFRYTTRSPRRPSHSPATLRNQIKKHESPAGNPSEAFLLTLRHRHFAAAESGSPNASPDQLILHPF